MWKKILIEDASRYPRPESNYSSSQNVSAKMLYGSNQNTNTNPPDNTSGKSKRMSYTEGRR
ncbi:MAG: hypothetical protein EYC69_12400 [Bacteroidetes bacterium]|nr:MAG: hypothetical protein EYC69_12400 [Bacteroidota bacterium]